MNVMGYVQRLSQAIGRRKALKLDAAFSTLDRRVVFNKIYSQNVWGKKSGHRFFSGPGSHDVNLVVPYVQSIKTFLRALNEKPSVVDLGCGDFNVGQHLRPGFENYIACDVVPDLIAHNAKQFEALSVDFRCLDMIEDALPKADVVMLREVFQHLSNQAIISIIDKISLTYRYLILTEDIPPDDHFVANLDKPIGPSTRAQFGSGVVLDAGPFHMKFLSKEIICEIPRENSRLRTTLYRFS